MSNKDKMIPICEPEIRGNEWKYVKECLDTGWVSSAGCYVDKFEQYLAGYIGRKYSVACTNGTAALHIALLVAGLNPNEEVLLPALTFVAPANAVRYTGAWPVFIDVSSDVWQIDPEKVKDFLTKECELKKQGLINRNTGRVVRAILPVHLMGHPVDMEPILDLAKRFNLLVIEDVAESLGATYKGKQLGSLGDIGVFSFNGNKIVTSGGGGMLVTDRKDWADKARYLTTQAKDDVLEFVHNEIGYNYRLTNVQAAIGLAQMENIDSYIVSKRNIAAYYREKLQNAPGISPMPFAVWANPSFWLYTIKVDEFEYCGGSRSLLKKLSSDKIVSRPLWHPLNSLKPFLGCYSYKIEVANQLYHDCLSLPSSVGLKREDQERVISAICVRKKDMFNEQ